MLGTFHILAEVQRDGVMSAVGLAEQLVGHGYVDTARVLGDGPEGAANELRRMVFEEAMKDPTIKAAAAIYEQALREHQHTSKLTDAIHRDDARKGFYTLIGAWLADNMYGVPGGDHRC